MAAAALASLSAASPGAARHQRWRGKVILMALSAAYRQLSAVSGGNGNGVKALAESAASALALAGKNGGISNGLISASMIMQRSGVINLKAKRKRINGG